MDLLSFDTRNEWQTWNTMYCTKVNRNRRAYVTYGGGPEGGLVHFRGIGTRGVEIGEHTRIPQEVQVRYKINPDSSEYIKLAMLDYEPKEVELHADDFGYMHEDIKAMELPTAEDKAEVAGLPEDEVELDADISLRTSMESDGSMS